MVSGFRLGDLPTICFGMGNSSTCFGCFQTLVVFCRLVGWSVPLAPGPLSLAERVFVTQACLLSPELQRDATSSSVERAEALLTCCAVFQAQRAVY